jgi:hypothetical protein
VYEKANNQWGTLGKTPSDLYIGRIPNDELSEIETNPQLYGQALSIYSGFSTEK